jgi:hypothetical protein
VGKIKTQGERIS